MLQPIFHLMSTFTPSQWLDIGSLARRKEGVGVGSLPLTADCRCRFTIRLRDEFATGVWPTSRQVRLVLMLFGVPFAISLCLND